MTIANSANHAYSIKAVKTVIVRFGSLFSLRRTHRPLIGGFFASASFSAPLWAGYGGEGVSPAGTLGRQSSNPAVCPPTPFGSGERVNKLIQGGHYMANTSISARPEQTHSPLFPLAARAARKAARQWFAGIPTQSLAAWRDTCRQDHCHGLPNADQRGGAFDDAFAREIGNLIIAGGRSHD